MSEALNRREASFGGTWSLWRGRGREPTSSLFFAELEAKGLLVRRRYSPRFASQVTGYTVAPPDDRGSSGRPVWFGGGKLASDSI